MLENLVLICTLATPPAQCWPSTAIVMFEMSTNEYIVEKYQGESVIRAAKKRGISLEGKYPVWRSISCSAGIEKLSQRGQGYLPNVCRDLGSADGHCNSPSFHGACPG
jgi:hypothetical protein